MNADVTEVHMTCARNELGTPSRELQTGEDAADSAF